MIKIPIFDSYWRACACGWFFGLMLLLQWWFPLRRQHFSTLRRVIRNISFAIPSFIALRLLMLPIPLLAATWAEEHNVGLINWLLPDTGVGLWAGRILGFLAFDYAYYWWHYATHKVALLRRFHMVHHTDLDMDVSTASRFHIGELLLSVVFRVALVVLVGIGFWVAIVYEVFFETAAQFHHANWRLPKKADELINSSLCHPPHARHSSLHCAG